MPVPTFDLSSFFVEKSSKYKKELKRRKKYTKTYENGSKKTVYATSAYENFDIPAIENVRCTTMPTYVGRTWTTVLETYKDIILIDKYMFMINDQNFFDSSQSREIIEYMDEMIDKYSKEKFWTNEFLPSQDALIHLYNTNQKIKNQNAKNSLDDGDPNYSITEELLPLDFDI